MMEDLNSDVQGGAEAETQSQADNTASLEAPAATPQMATKDALKTVAEQTVKADALPEFLKDVPQQFHGETVEETLQKALTGWKGLRAKLSQGEEAAAALPDSADKYELDVGDNYKTLAGTDDLAKDPLLGAFRTAAFEQGVAPEVAQTLLSSVIDSAFEAGLLEKPLQMSEFYEAVGGEAEGSRLVADIKSRIDVAAANGVFGEGDEAAKAGADILFDLAVESPAALKAMHQLLTHKAPSSLVAPTQTNSELELTSANLTKLSSDPRYDSTSPQHDPAYRKKVDAMWDEFDRQN